MLDSQVCKQAACFVGEFVAEYLNNIFGHQLGIICSSFLWGYLADTTGRKRVMQPTLFLAFLATFLSTFTTSFSTFALLRFLNGFL